MSLERQDPPAGGSSPPSNGFQKLVKEAHRRSLWQVMIIYLGASWGVLEAADHVIARFGMPDWAYGTAVLLLLVGFPIVMATAIVQEGIGGESGGPGVDGEPEHAGVGRQFASPSVRSPRAGSGARDLAPGTGSLDRPNRRPSQLARLLTWRNAILGGMAAFGLWGVAATVLLVMGSGGRSAGRASLEEADADQLRAIAVLPFENLSADAENAYFADGIHEDVLTQLSKIGDLTVISRTSVLPYRQTQLSLSEIAGELGVGSILEGSVRRAGDNVRITAQLIDAQTDQHLWADNFDRALTTANVFAIQTEIAERIADALAARLSPTEASRISRVPTADLTAYDRYLRGRDVYQRYTPTDNERAIELFQEAIALDSAYAEAYAGLADAYGQRIQIGGFGQEWADSALVQARRAIELNPEGASGYKALGLAYSMKGHGREALEANLAAVERDPNHHAAVNNVGVQESALGRLDEALRWYKRGARLDPTAFGPANVAYSYARLGEAEIARAYFAENVDVAENEPMLRLFFGMALELIHGDLAAARSHIERWRGQVDHDVFFHVYDGFVHHLERDFPAALAAARRAESMAPGASLTVSFRLETILGYALLRTGNVDEGRRRLQASRGRLEERIARGADSPAFLWELAAIATALGDTAAGLEFAARARSEGYQPANDLTAFDPMLDPIRDDPAFRRLVASSAVEIERMRLEIEAEEIANGER